MWSSLTGWRGRIGRLLSIGCLLPLSAAGYELRAPSISVDRHPAGSTAHCPTGVLGDVSFCPSILGLRGTRLARRTQLLAASSKSSSYTPMDDTWNYDLLDLLRQARAGQPTLLTDFLCRFAPLAATNDDQSACSCYAASTRHPAKLNAACSTADPVGPIFSRASSSPLIPALVGPNAMLTCPPLLPTLACGCVGRK